MEEYNINIETSTPNYLSFTLRSSPSVNKINFIKNKSVNLTTKRKYATAEVYLNDKIYDNIKDYYKSINISLSKVALLSYISTIKVDLNKTKNNKNFTKLNRRNIIKTEKSKKYYNKYSSTHTTPKYILSKGYGKQLLRYVEQYLKDIGIEYIVLTPMSKPLIDYYTKLGYSVKIIPNNSVDKLNNNEMQRTPNSYVSENIIMYKKL